MMRVPREEMKKNMPHDLIVFCDANGRQRILVLVPKCQRIALTHTDVESLIDTILSIHIIMLRYTCIS